MQDQIDRRDMLKVGAVAFGAAGALATPALSEAKTQPVRYLTVKATNFIVASSTSTGWTPDYTCDGVDDQVEIQQAIDALPTAGGSVVLTNGVFNISAPININKHNVQIYGVGAGQKQGATHDAKGTRLEASTGLTGQMLKVQLAGNTQPVHGVILRDFTIDGKSLAGPIDGILWRSYRGLLQNLHVFRFTGNGVDALGYASWALYESFYTKLRIYECGAVGLFLDTDSTDGQVENCILGTNGINMKVAGGSMLVEQCHLFNPTTNNLVMVAGSRSKFSCCKIEGASEHGVILDVTSNALTDVVFTGCGFASNGKNTTQSNPPTVSYSHIKATRSSGTQKVTRLNVGDCNFTTKTNDPKADYFIDLGTDSSLLDDCLVDGVIFGATGTGAGPFTASMRKPAAEITIGTVVNG